MFLFLCITIFFYQRKYKKYRKPQKTAEEVPPNALVEDEFKIQESDEKFEADSKAAADTGSSPEAEGRDAILPLIGMLKTY